MSVRGRLLGRALGEGGYSLVEVMASIVILTVAIIPMVGMFDAGLRAVTDSGSYDRARALANQNLERAKALPYDAPGAPADSAVEVFAPGPSPVPCPAPPPSGFTCLVETRYVDANLANPRTAPKTSRMRVSVTVGWGGGKKYTTAGLVAGAA